MSLTDEAAHTFFRSLGIFCAPQRKTDICHIKTPLPKKTSSERHPILALIHLQVDIPPKTNMTTENNHLKMYLLSKLEIFHPVMFLFRKVSVRCFIFFFLVGLAIQVGFTKDFGRDSAICRKGGYISRERVHIHRYHLITARGIFSNSTRANNPNKQSILGPSQKNIENVGYLGVPGI